MGGSIGYQAPASGGSLFRVELALEIGAVSQAQPIVTLDPPRQILLVEDDAIAAAVTQSLLASYGHNVTAVSNSASALEALVAGSHDLVLLDIGIDGDREGGLLTARRICELANDKTKLTIVALTANALIEDHLRFFAAGFDAVLIKPLSLDHGLGAQIEEAKRAANRHLG